MRLERFRFRAVGSPCVLSFWSESRYEAATLAEACGEEIDRLERKYSRYRKDSLTSRINRLRFITAPHCLVAGITSTIAMLHAESDVGAFLTRVGLPHLLITQSGKRIGSVRVQEEGQQPRSSLRVAS